MFESSHASTGNPNDPEDHYGEWLYDVRVAHVVTPDGTDLTDAIEKVTSLRGILDEERRRFDDDCRREARRVASRHRDEVLEERRRHLMEAAQSRFQEEVVRPYDEAYARWRYREQQMQRARRRAEQMRATRPEWRHCYIDGDVEQRMQADYARTNGPRPTWGVLRPEARRAEEQAVTECEQVLADEGWDWDSEFEHALTQVRERRDPAGSMGVSPRTARRHDELMAEIRRHPEAEELVGTRRRWGATMGMPRTTPQGMAGTTRHPVREEVIFP